MLVETENDNSSNKKKKQKVDNLAILLTGTCAILIIPCSTVLGDMQCHPLPPSLPRAVWELRGYLLSSDTWPAT